MRKQKKDKRRQSTQQLMGIQKITDYCISTARFIMTGSSRKRIRRSGTCWNRTDSIWTRCRWK